MTQIFISTQFSVVYGLNKQNNDKTKEESKGMPEVKTNVTVRQRQKV